MNRPKTLGEKFIRKLLSLLGKKPEETPVEQAQPKSKLDVQPSFADSNPSDEQPEKASPGPSSSLVVGYEYGDGRGYLQRVTDLIPNKKYYVIRSIAFLYNDEYFYETTPGGIEKIFTSEEEAMTALGKLQVSRMKSTSVRELELFFDYHEDRFQRFFNFLSKSIESREFDLGAYQEKIRTDHFTYLPPQLSDSQVLSFLEMFEISFYTICEYDSVPSFYCLETQSPYFDEPQIVQKWNGAILYFNSEQEATIGAAKLLVNFNSWGDGFAGGVADGVGLVGGIKELTEFPDVLNDLINSSEFVRYVEDTKYRAGHISFSSNCPLDHIQAILAVLKKPVFKIMSISLEEVIEYPSYSYEGM